MSYGNRGTLGSKRKRAELDDAFREDEPADELGIPEEVNEEDEDGDEDEDEESDMDGDAPRAVAWQDDDMSVTDEDGSEDDEGTVEMDGDGTSAMTRLQREMASLPFGTLLEAREEIDSSSSEEDSEEEPNPEAELAEEQKSEDEGPKDWKLAADRKAVPKRVTKTAPVAVTSKKPVSRFRQVVEVKKFEARDPRFSALSGDFDQVKFSKRYSFITDLQKQEAAALRKELREAKKDLSNTDGPTWRAERRVQDLRRTLNRTETTIKRSRQETREREVLTKAKKEEREKQAQGKGAWHMKDSDKRKLLLESKFSDLAEEGGQRKVKRVLEKKQKKIAQQEKRNRPYAKGEFYGSAEDAGPSPPSAAPRTEKSRRGRNTMREGGRSMPAPGGNQRSSFGGGAPKRQRYS